MNTRNVAIRRKIAKHLVPLFLFFCLLLSHSETCAKPPAEWIAQEIPQLTQLYKSLHQSPELSFQEEKTAARMAEELRSLKFVVTPHIGGHGVVGVLENGSGKTLLLRADMDALPVAEETGLPYASKVRIRDARGVTVGVMHACGHDMHMTNLVGAARYLAKHRDEWQGTLVAIFQPAEERGAGAKAMIEEGLLTKFPRPHFAIALHVAHDTPTGSVGYRAGYAQANVDSVDIKVRGRGGHGAYPHATIDPIVIAARLVLDLQTIVSREIKPIEPAVVTVGSIHGSSAIRAICNSPCAAIARKCAGSYSTPFAEKRWQQQQVQTHRNQEFRSARERLRSTTILNWSPKSCPLCKLRSGKRN